MLLVLGSPRHGNYVGYPHCMFMETWWITNDMLKLSFHCILRYVALILYLVLETIYSIKLLAITVKRICDTLACLAMVATFAESITDMIIHFSLFVHRDIAAIGRLNLILNAMLDTRGISKSCTEPVVSVAKFYVVCFWSMSLSLPPGSLLLTVLRR